MTIRAAILLAGSLALGGCALWQSERRDVLLDEEESPLDRNCRAESKTAPNVRALARQTNVMNDFNTERMADLRRTEEASAFRDCLRRAGVPLPGGVATVRPR